MLKKMRLVVLSFVVLFAYGVYSSSAYAVGSSSGSSYPSLLLASSEKDSVYTTARGDTLSSLNASYYDGLTAEFLLDGALALGYLMGIKPNVFGHFEFLYPFDLESDVFALGLMGSGAYSFGFTSYYELQTGCGLALWYASYDGPLGDSSVFRLYLNPRISNIFHITNHFAVNLDLLFSAKLYSSRSRDYAKRRTLDIGLGAIYKL